MKTIIYLRTSTEEQNPENQLNDCIQLVNRLSLGVYEVFQEKQSAFNQEKEREVFNSIQSQIKQNKISNLIVWDLDRLYRNRKKLIEFFQFCKIYKCRIYSFRQDWFESLNKIQEPFNEIMFDLMLSIMGWLAEEESRKKSERVKIAVIKGEGVTQSYKGNKWGRKSIISERLKDKIKELKEKGFSFRQIQKNEEIYFYDKHKNKKKPSLATIHNLFKEISIKL